MPIYTLVDGRPYRLGAIEWAEIIQYNGNLEVHPVHVRFKNGREGQYKLHELLAVRIVDPVQNSSS